MKATPIFNTIAPVADQHWFEIVDRAADSPCEINIAGEIGGWGVSARSLTDRIKSLDENRVINLHIFSGGGEAFEGNEIYNVLKDHKGIINVTIGALCGSIATVIACAGDTIKMCKNGMFMVHNPSTICYGESSEFRKLADIMDKVKSTIVNTYVARTKKTADFFNKLMDATTWMDADEALENGFIDAILDTESDEVIEDIVDTKRIKNSAQALSKLREKWPLKVAATLPGNGKPPASEEKPQSPSTSLLEDYMKNKISIFAGVAASLVPTFSEAKIKNTAAPSILDTRIKNETPAPEPAREAIIAEAKKLYSAKVARDKEIDDIVNAVRKRDKRDFGELAATFKLEDKSADEFARAIATSDKFKPFEVVASGNEELPGSAVPNGGRIEVLGERGLVVGTPGELFIASAEYKTLRDSLQRGTHAHAHVVCQTTGFIESAINRFLNATTTSTGLTSIQKLPGVVGLGVRPLMVKDLIAPGATTNTTIRYIRESVFANGAGMVAEGAAKPEASFVFVEVDAPVKKIAAWTKVSDELFADYLAVASFINMRLPYMVERVEEDQLLNGDGTGQNLTGILVTPGIQTQAKGADTAVDAIYKSITKVRWGNLAGAAQGGFEPDGIIMHPTDWEAIRLSKDANNQYFGGGPFTGAYGNGGGNFQFEMLWGKPVVVTPAIAQGLALTGAFRLASQYFQRQGLVIESTNTDQDDFIKNLTTIRAEERLALAVYRPLVFCQITGL